jgi:hypothetical protein
VQGMAALGNYVRFLPRESETETERFEADWTLGLFFRGVSWRIRRAFLGVVVKVVGVGVDGGDLRRV